MSQSLSAQEKLRLQKHLFHSTSAKRLGFTCQIKFDTHLSGSHMYGRGCYFTVSADQADRYAQAGKGGLRHMFLAKVLVGKCTRGKKHYCQPPQTESGSKCFDSCVDNVASPNIYVIFNSYQCYPYFLISYKLLSDPVVLDDWWTAQGRGAVNAHYEYAASLMRTHNPSQEQHTILSLLHTPSPSCHDPFKMFYNPSHGDAQWVLGKNMSKSFPAYLKKESIWFPEGLLSPDGQFANSC